MSTKLSNTTIEAQASKTNEVSASTNNKDIMVKNNKTTEVSASPRANAELTGPSATAEFENGHILLINRQVLAMAELKECLPYHGIPHYLSEIVNDELGENASPEDYASCLIYLGARFTEEGEFYTAYKCFRESLEYGSAPEIWFNLGMCFWQGKGVCQCYELAVLCFWMAAELPDALLMLAHAYDEGKGVKEDQYMTLQLIEEEEAARSRKVGKVSDQQAKYALAVSLDEGLGMKKNRRKAFKLWAELAEDGYEPAYEKAAYQYWGRYQDGEDRTKAKYFAGLAAAQGYVDSQYLFGLMSHSDGDSIIGSFYINLAAQQGHEGAINYIDC